MEVKQIKKFTVSGSMSFLYKYKYIGKEITVHLTDGNKFTGKLSWFDVYALKIILPEGSITIPIHNIAKYECEDFLLGGEQPDNKSKVFRGSAKPTNKEIEQLKRYKQGNELIHFYLRDGIEVRGRLNWVQDYAYAVRQENSNRDCIITKRQILYYQKIEV